MTEPSIYEKLLDIASEEALDFVRGIEYIASAVEGKTVFPHRDVVSAMLEEAQETLASYVEEKRACPGECLMGNPKSSTSAVIDLETSHLDPRHGVVMEIAVLAVDADFRPCDRGVSVVVHHTAEDLRAVSDHVTWPMHTANGLIAECAESEMSLSEAENQVLDYLHPHGDLRQVRLMNNNAPFERAWFAEHLPKLQEWLHYRNLDVSAVGELMRTRFPEIYYSAPAKPSTHRALTDVHACARQLRHYANNLLPARRFRADELPEFIRDDVDQGRVQERDGAVIRDFGTPDDAIDFAMRLISAASIVRRRTDTAPVSDAAARPVMHVPG